MLVLHDPGCRQNETQPPIMTLAEMALGCRQSSVRISLTIGVAALLKEALSLRLSV